MAVRPSRAIAVLVAGALGLGALGWAAGALPGGDEDEKRCRYRDSGYEQPSEATSDPRG